MINEVVSDGRPISAPRLHGLARLAKMTFDGDDMAPVWEELTGTIKTHGSGESPHPLQCAALMDMALIDQMRGHDERAMSFQQHALRHCRLYQIPARSGRAQRTVLAFAAPGRINANVPIEFLIEDSDVTLYLLYVVPGMPLPPAPDHDVAIVLAAESEASRPVLAEIERLTAAWPRPVLNAPALIPLMGREQLFPILAPIRGLTIPASVVVTRPQMEALADPDHALDQYFPSAAFPMIARPVDSHAGDGLTKIEAPAEIVGYLGERPEGQFCISPFVDYRSPDGQFRKYRIIFVDGIPYPCHMATSAHWMIHYLNAGMAESAEKRAEEQRFLERFEEGFGTVHRAALAQVAEAIRLDYFGIDCGETPDGRLLIFEASTALVVHAMDQPDIFPYKKAPMQRIFDSFFALLNKRAE